MEEVAVSVLLKLIIDGNERCQQWRPLVHEHNSSFKCKQHAIHDPWGQEKYHYKIIKREQTLYKE